MISEGSNNFAFLVHQRVVHKLSSFWVSIHLRNLCGIVPLVEVLQPLRKLLPTCGMAEAAFHDACWYLELMTLRATKDQCAELRRHRWISHSQASVLPLTGMRVAMVPFLCSLRASICPLCLQTVVWRGGKRALKHAQGATMREDNFIQCVGSRFPCRL